MTQTKSAKSFPSRDELPSDVSPCEFCNGRCCRYFALPIDTPGNYQEFDYLRWFLTHENASVFRDDETYYLLVHSKCRNLDDQNRCKIYSTRPKICRDYSSEKCEYLDVIPYEGYFEVPEQVEEYAEAILGPRPGRSFRSAKNQDEGW